MKVSCTRPLMAVLLPIIVTALHTVEATAQSSGDARLGIHQVQVFPDAAPPPLALQEGSTPRWVKWGLIGAAAGAVTFALLSGTDTDGDRSATEDAALGAVFGFAILGGAIAFYDWVCKPGSGSQRARLC